MESVDVFEVLVREHAAMLRAFIGATVADDSAADDLWQDTMLTAWRRWDDYDRDRPFGAWLRGIASKKILAWNRKCAGGPIGCDEAALDHFQQVFGRIQRLSGDTFHEKLEALRECVGALPEAYREIVRLRYSEELMPAKVAERQSMKLDTVKKRLQRAKSILFDCINRKLELSAKLGLSES